MTLIVPFYPFLFLFAYSGLIPDRKEVRPMLSEGDLVKLLGISGHFRGFPQLVTSINLAVANEDLLNPISTRLYALVAAHHDVSIESVISNLRYLVEVWWKRGNRNFSPEYSIKGAKRPSCKAFVYSLVVYIQRKAKKEQ